MNVSLDFSCFLFLKNDGIPSMWVSCCYRGGSTIELLLTGWEGLNLMCLRLSTSTLPTNRRYSSTSVFFSSTFPSLLDKHGMWKAKRKRLVCVEAGGYILPFGLATRTLKETQACLRAGLACLFLINVCPPTSHVNARLDKHAHHP